jgi:hypothetical protein
MKTKPLSQETIKSIINNAESSPEALLNLYKEVLKPIDWDTIEKIQPWAIKVHEKTNLFILDEMHKKFSEGLGQDRWYVNSIVLNKGFSSYNSGVNEWEATVSDDCVTFKSKEDDSR